MRRPILPITALVVAGVLIGRYAEPAFAAAALAACCGAILFPVGRMRRKALLEYAGLTLLLLSTGMLLQMKGRPPLLDSFPTTWQGKITGIIEEQPEVRRMGRDDEDDTEAETEQTFLTVNVVTKEGRRTGWLVNAYVPGRVEARYGDLLRLRGKMRLFPEERNPGQLNYREYLLRKRVIAGISLPAQEAMQRVGAGKGNFLKGAMLRVKGEMGRALSRGLDEDGQRIVGAMVLGERRGVSGELEEDFVKSGTAHILTVSGFHIGVAAFFAWVVMRLLRTGIVAQAIAVCAVAVGYSALTGFAPASVRAAAMICCWRGAVIVKRRADGSSALALALLVVLAVLGGNELLSPGLQLSFAAIGAIVILSPRLEAMMGGRTREPWEMLLPRSALWRGMECVGNQIRKLAAIGAAAWIGTTPVLAYHFHIIAPAALIGNLVVVPLAVAVIPLGLLAGTLGLPISAASPAIVLKPFVWLLQRAVELLARLPGGHFYTVGPGGLWVAVFFGAIAAGVWRHKLKIGTGRYALAATLLAAGYTWQGTVVGQRAKLECTVLDVGAGLATCVVLPGGEVMVFDAGSRNIPSVGQRIVAPFLWERGIRRIDLLLLSHTHSDHTSGVADLLERVPVKCVGVPVGFGLSETGAELLEVFRKNSMGVLVLGQGDVLRFGDTTLRVLNPPKDAGLLELLDENERSMVVGLEHEQGRFLFTGDAADFAMHRLASSSSEGAWDVVVLPHHGLNPETALDLLHSIKPSVALVSYTETPPGTETLGVPVMDTASAGAITVEASSGGIAPRGHIGGEPFLPKGHQFDSGAGNGRITSSRPDGGAT